MEGDRLVKNVGDFMAYLPVCAWPVLNYWNANFYVPLGNVTCQPELFMETLWTSNGCCVWKEGFVYCLHQEKTQISM